MLATLKRLARFTVNHEIADIDDRWAPLERLFLVGFIVLFTLVFVRTYPTIFLGFGIGDEFEWSLIQSFFQTLHDDSPTLLYTGVAMLVANVLFRLQLFLRGQLAYRSNHPDLPMKTIAVFMVGNALNIVFVVGTVALLGGMALLAGFDFATGFMAVEHLFQLALTLADQVPTLVELPLVVAFFVTYMVQGFFHYWIHRLCHLNRFLWLTLHRFHHMPPVLTPATTNVVITSIPFFLGMVFVKTLIFAAIAKLFYERQLFMEMFFFHLIITFADGYGHQTALFKEGIRSRFIRWLCLFSNNGVYHYLHHSRDKEIVTTNTTNQVNIGGGLFYFWDWVFGTFHRLPAATDPQPKAGLWGNPALHHNPVRLVLSGLIQICYELWHNRNLNTRFWILFGSVNYAPPITRPFHISAGECKARPDAGQRATGRAA